MGELSNATINGVSYDFKDAGAARQSHSHTKSQITDFPTSMPASDVPAWAKASSKPTYTASEVGAVPNTTLSGSPDLDTYLTTGVYHITTSTATHAPTTNHATLFVDATVGTPYQIFKPDNIDATWYTRHRSGSAWTSWVAMKFTDTTYSAATTSAAGLMSATDKSKLDGLPSPPSGFTKFSTLPGSLITGDEHGGFVMYGPIVYIVDRITVPSETNRVKLFAFDVDTTNSYPAAYPLPPMPNETVGNMDMVVLDVPILDRNGNILSDCRLELQHYKRNDRSMAHYEAYIIFSTAKASSTTVLLFLNYIGKSPANNA